jgi:hypothetical protein
MPAPIVVDVGTPEPPREHAQALLDACTQAAVSAGTECRLVRDAPNEPYAAIAIVTWEDDHARVEVGIRREPVSEWRTRELTFQAADVALERYRSVGFVIGTLSIAARDEAPAAPPPESAPPAEPASPSIREPAPSPAPEPGSDNELPAPAAGRGWVGVAGMIGGGLDRGSARLGGELSVGVRVMPHLSVVLTGGASTRARDELGLRPTWLDAGVGLAVTLGLPRAFHLDLRALLIAEQFSVDVKNAGEGVEMSRTTVGGRFGVDAVLPLVGILELVVGGEGTARPATRMRVTGKADGATRNLELGAIAGLRVEL